MAIFWYGARFLLFGVRWGVNSQFYLLDPIVKLLVPAKQFAPCPGEVPTACDLRYCHANKVGLKEGVTPWGYMWCLELSKPHASWQYFLVCEYGILSVDAGIGLLDVENTSELELEHCKLGRGATAVVSQCDCWSCGAGGVVRCNSKSYGECCSA